jgi:hypothetical protein
MLQETSHVRSSSFASLSYMVFESAVEQQTFIVTASVMQPQNLNKINFHLG